MMNAQAKYFNEKASVWDSISIVNPGKIEHILDVSDLNSGDRVLDVGTGTGVLIPYLLKRIGSKGNIDGVDISEGMLDEARKKFGAVKHVTLSQADAELDEFNRQYDRIILYCVYPNLRHPMPTLQKLVRENLRPGGTLLIAHPYGREHVNKHNGESHLGQCDRLFPVADLLEEMENYGLHADYTEDNSAYYIVRIRK